MELEYFIVNAFSNGPFTGNPAAVLPLDEWLSDDLLQQIAMQNNLSETAYVVSENEGYHIRWFTPKKEVLLCGHATLATAFVLFENNHNLRHIHFESLSGPLNVNKRDGIFTLDFPQDNMVPDTLPDRMIQALSEHQPLAILKGREDYMLMYEEESTVLNMMPDFQVLAEEKIRGFIVSAPGSDYDYVSRCFYPACGINEDPATGSSQTGLALYWRDHFNKTSFTCKQYSKRGGYFKIELKGDRVLISGKAELFAEGRLFI